MSIPKELASFFGIFNQLDDPRIERTRLYLMSEILLEPLCGIAAGCDGWSDIELFAQQCRIAKAMRLITLLSSVMLY